ncbi:MAG TPA: hypothetical protein VMR95_02640 [Candidatus Binatia bacterium]|nr:hypothetical protein [Candidatus Binatia bacterium]
MKTVSIVRSRGQLTIPDSVRKAAKWVEPMSAVSVTLVKPDQIVIQPHKSYVDWEEIWAGIRHARAIKGKAQTGSTVDFLQKDRISH